MTRKTVKSFGFPAFFCRAAEILRVTLPIETIVPDTISGPAGKDGL